MKQVFVQDYLQFSLMLYLLNDDRSKRWIHANLFYILYESELHAQLIPI